MHNNSSVTVHRVRLNYEDQKYEIMKGYVVLHCMLFNHCTAVVIWDHLLGDLQLW